MIRITFASCLRVCPILGARSDSLPFTSDCSLRTPDLLSQVVSMMLWMDAGRRDMTGLLQCSSGIGWCAWGLPQTPGHMIGSSAIVVRTCATCPSGEPHTGSDIPSCSGNNNSCWLLIEKTYISVLSHNASLPFINPSRLCKLHVSSYCSA